MITIIGISVVVTSVAMLGVILALIIVGRDE